MLYASSQVGHPERRERWLVQSGEPRADSIQVQEIVIDYSTCADQQDNQLNFQPVPSDKHYEYFKSGDGQPPQWQWNATQKTYWPGLKPVNTTVCSIQFNLPNSIGPPVLFYYRLSNFFQNHRRYVKSLDSNQLSGLAVDNGTLSTGDCDPLYTDATGKPYYPCGLIANSLFNDTFSSPLWLDVTNSSSLNETYVMTNQGIAWSSDAALYGMTAYNYSQIAVPPNWVKRWGPDGYTADNPPPNLNTDEAFQVWMRLAGLPTFNKLAMRNDSTPMNAGTYQVDIEMSTFKSQIVKACTDVA